MAEDNVQLCPHPLGPATMYGNLSAALATTRYTQFCLEIVCTYLLAVYLLYIWYTNVVHSLNPSLTLA